LSLWWTGFFIDIDELPNEVFLVWEEIKSVILKEYGEWYYSIDLSNTDKGVKLIELNSSTGFLLASDDKEDFNTLFLEYLAEFIVNIK